jgi:hypothetical protein
MMNNNSTAPSADTSSFSTYAGRPATAHGIDIEQLAEKVYRLMQSELRLTRARGGTSRVRK